MVNSKGRHREIYDTAMGLGDNNQLRLQYYWCHTCSNIQYLSRVENDLCLGFGGFHTVCQPDHLWNR
jgi:hypothetical protein